MDFDLLRFPSMTIAIALGPFDSSGVAVLHECRNTFAPGPPHRLKNYPVVIYDRPRFRDAHGFDARLCLASLLRPPSRSEPRGDRVAMS